MKKFKAFHTPHLNSQWFIDFVVSRAQSEILADQLLQDHQETSLEQSQHVSASDAWWSAGMSL